MAGELQLNRASRTDDHPAVATVLIGALNPEIASEFDLAVVPIDDALLDRLIA